ncbi:MULTISPECIES: IS66-like element accessory protein TnpA [unclassified Variovorax]|uniref:IS66-like element accessory protein TnpA n=1 Tax=unclassified Variovorax TaxID=663243 RepID=UPI003F46EBBD
MDTYGIDLMGRRRRRRHTPEFKASVIAQCMRPGVSVAAVALAHSLNANMLRKWVIDAQHNPPTLPPAVSPQEPPPQPAPTFIPLALTAPAIEGDIRIELQRSGTIVTVVWPASAAAACAAWLRDWLR